MFEALDLLSSGQIRNPNTGRSVNSYEVRSRRSGNKLFTIMVDAELDSKERVARDVVSTLENSYKFKNSLHNLYLQLRLLAPFTKHPQQHKDRMVAMNLLGIVEDQDDD